jgi:hypothetical protein
MKDYASSNASSLNKSSSPYVSVRLPRGAKEPSYTPYGPSIVDVDESDELAYLRKASLHQARACSESIGDVMNSARTQTYGRSTPKPTSFSSFLQQSVSGNQPLGSTIDATISIGQGSSPRTDKSQIDLNYSTRLNPYNAFDQSQIETSRSRNFGLSQISNQRSRNLGQSQINTDPTRSSINRPRESFDSNAAGDIRGNSENSTRSHRFDQSFVDNSSQLGASTKSYLDESSFSSPPKRAPRIPQSDSNSLKSVLKPPGIIFGDAQKSARFNPGNDRHYSHTSFVSDELENSFKRSSRRRESNLDEADTAKTVPMSIYDIILV